MADTATPAQTLAIAVDVAPSITAVTNALASIFKLGDAIFETLNSPQMLAARQRADVQAILVKMDADLKSAQAMGNLAKLDAEVSG